MKTTILIIYLLLVNVVLAIAYPNLYGTAGNAESSEPHRGLPAIARTFNVEFAEKYIAYFDFNNKKKYSYKDLSDAAVYLMQLGRVAEAHELLKWLHLNHPNEYNITANLATSFELNGAFDSATVYINKASLFKPTSHHNSDWVQLKIIEAKKKMIKDSKWVLNHHVIDLKWDTTFYATYPDSMYSKKQRDSLRQARYERYENEFDTLWHIGLQIGFQIPFSPSPNLMIANVMIELASYFEHNLSIKDAFVAYKIALYYDPQNQLNTQQKLNNLMPIFKKYEFEESVFEEKFYPAAALTEADIKKLSDFRAAQESSEALFWEAKAALCLIGLLIIGFWVHKRWKR